MRLLLLCLALSVAGISASSYAQPVTFEEPATLPAPGATAAPPAGTVTPPAESPAAPATPAAPPATLPSTLPDLTPDKVTKDAPDYVPPALTMEGKSTVDPRLEPWEKERRKSRAQEAEKIFRQLPMESQNQILDETYYVHRQCGIYQTYAQFHDCDCVGSIYFEERIFDPESSRDAIVGRIAGYCVSLPGAAAFGYDQCLSGMRFVLMPDRVEEYCRCYALQFGKSYQNSPYPDFDNLRLLGKQTGSYCNRQVPSAFKKQ